MSDTAPIAPAGVDTEKPSAARVYDWYLGGTHHWAVDREFGRRHAGADRLVGPVCLLMITVMYFIGPSDEPDEFAWCAVARRPGP